MKVTPNSLMLFAMLLVAVAGACVAATAMLPLPALLLAVVAYALAFLLIKHSVKGYNTLAVLFLVFFFLYNYTAPITVVQGVEPEGYFGEATLPVTAEFIYQVSLALLAFSLPFVVIANRHGGHSPLPAGRYTRRMLILAILLAAGASAGEVVNLLRAGGTSVLLQGKAVYQEATSDLFITIPSAFMAHLAFACLGFGLVGYYDGKLWRMVLNKKFLAFVVSILPVMLIYVVLGRRGPLLGWALSFIIGFTFLRYKRSVGLPVISLALVGYFLLAFLFVARAQIAIAIKTGDTERMMRELSRPERYEKLNPAYNEFGAAFLNFTRFRLREKEVGEQRLYGESYLGAVLVPVPRFLLPFEKPPTITYRFRDMFYESEAKRSRIAGTGFSSVLEAYWNFGFLGVLPVYFLVGCLLFWAERRRASLKGYSILFVGAYLIFVPLMQSFHRSAFGLPFGIVLVTLVLYNVAGVLFVGDRSFYKRVVGRYRGSAGEENAG
ncbi:O-antigen polymerase [Roseivirga sp. BDSF3-8]|uniref:O-antigen polymerase n=1 Tax=Roseivirga sp. BDSF3-8 TaxID=3241598 RepID=UPI00353210C4